MAHTAREKEKLIARVKRIRGQMEGLERALEAEVPCAEILRQLASVRGAMNGLAVKVMEDHVYEHVLAAPTDADRRQGSDEMIEVIRTYMK